MQGIGLNNISDEIMRNLRSITCNGKYVVILHWFHLNVGLGTACNLYLTTKYRYLSTSFFNNDFAQLQNILKFTKGKESGQNDDYEMVTIKFYYQLFQGIEKITGCK